MASIAYNFLNSTDEQRKAAAAHDKREKDIAQTVIKDVLTRQLRNEIASARRQAEDAQHAAATFQLELEAHLANQPTETAQVQDWVIRRMTLEASVPIARKQAEERKAALDEVLTRVRQLLLREWSKRNQASLEALEAEKARLVLQL